MDKEIMHAYVNGVMSEYAYCISDGMGIKGYSRKYTQDEHEIIQALLDDLGDYMARSIDNGVAERLINRTLRRLPKQENK